MRCIATHYPAKEQADDTPPPTHDRGHAASQFLDLDLPRFCGRVVFQMPSVSLSLDDAPFGSDLSMRGLTPQAPEALRFSNARKNPIALEAL
jgi:hypothetical protein